MFLIFAGGGQACVEVLAQSSQNCPGIPITIPIPLPSGEEISIEITGTPEIQLFGTRISEACARVEVNAPRCS